MNWSPRATRYGQVGALVRPSRSLPRDHDWSCGEVETVWGGDPPSDALHRHRNALGRRTAVVRPHELRHTGPPWPRLRAQPPRSWCAGWGTPPRAAALIYQHAADEGDGEIARALDTMLEAVLVPPTRSVSNVEATTAARSQRPVEPRARQGEAARAPAVYAVCTCPPPPTPGSGTGGGQ